MLARRSPDGRLACACRQLSLKAGPSCMQGLLEQLQDMAQDTAAFAVQQKADAERTKRSFSQARCSADAPDAHGLLRP